MEPYPILDLDVDLDPRLDEEALVRAWHVEQLRRLGLSRILAEMFAGRVDWHELAALVARGCPLDLALEIAR
jgi:hypothetical protein